MEQESQQKKSLLIIKSHAQGLAPAEAFLKNRGWDIKSTANLKEALVFLVQNQPQFVMISIDHPNRKVRNLPKVLAQAFPVCVIAFSETASAANIKILSETSAEYAIFPPITGPAIERTVSKYYKDQQTKDLTSGSKGSAWEQSSDGQQSSMIAIKGGGASSEAAKNILAQLLAGDGGDAIGTTGSFSTSDNLAAVGSSNPGENTATTSANPSSSKDLNDRTNATKSSSDSANNSAEENNGYYSSPLTDSDEPRPVEHTPRQKDNGPGWAPIEQKEKPKVRPGIETIDQDISAQNQDSLMSQGARDALNKSCINFKEEVAPLEKTTNVTCISVESSRFSGYLIAAMAKDKTIDTVFIERIRSRLFKFLRQNGESVEDSQSMPVKIREVPFEDWALAHAEFLRKSVHNGEEIAMAFFPRRDLKAKLLDCSDSEMAAIHIDELSADVQVEFNVYIYLPRNNKYLLYTPCGGTFFSTQKNRLVNQGVSHLHILRMEQASLDKYRAQNFLNNKIDEFESKEREKILV